MESIQKKYDYAEFGSRLKEARESAGFTQAQACKAVGLPKAQVLSSYERGISNPPIDTLAALAKLYSVSLDDLVFADEKPQTYKTTGDWLFSLVQAVDELLIFPELANKDFDANIDRIASGLLIWGENSIYNDFFGKWRKLHDAWMDNLIDVNDYYLLVRRHANQVPDDPKYAKYQERREELSQNQGADDTQSQGGFFSRFLDVVNPLFYDLDEE